MNQLTKKMTRLFLLLLLLGGCLSVGRMTAYAADETTAAATEETSGGEVSGKALGAGIALGLAALGGTIGMGVAVGKSNESVARQPEEIGNIRTLMMLGLVFIETVVIYALIVAILIIFVL